MIDLLRILKMANVGYEAVASILFLKKLNSERVYPKDFRRILPDPEVGEEMIREVLRILEEMGVLEGEGSEAYTVKEDPFSIYPRIRMLEEIVTEISLNRVRLVYSIPEDLRPAGPDVLRSDLPWEYIKLVRDSRRSLKIVNPFFSDETSKILETILPGKTEDGVKVEVFTREVMNKDGNFKYLSRLVKSIIEDGMPKNFRIFEFSEEVGFLHAKVLVRDGCYAYIGSANLTSASFKKSLEIGVLIHGEIVKKLEQFIDNLKRTAFKPVSLNSFQV